MRERVLITGGAGFIGHHMVEACLQETDWEIVVWDKLTYASSGVDRLRAIDYAIDGRLKVLTCDFSTPISPGVAKETGPVDYIIHMGAESSVDLSIADPEVFVRSNVLGTMRMLDFARTQGNLKGFVQVGTDEVYGTVGGDYRCKETDAYNCANPYSASKAGAMEMAMAYYRSYRVPVMVATPTNAFGERQHPEKFVPAVIRAVLRGDEMPIWCEHGNPGARTYIYARHIASAILHLLKSDMVLLGHKYNIEGQRKLDNLNMAQRIADYVGKLLRVKMIEGTTVRPGYDYEYGLDGSKLAEYGWTPPDDFDECLRKTVEWTAAHPEWLEIP